ncbi:MAG: hypothetical protein WC091_15945 [Sulfuricellaceae bacterium]
MRKNWKFPCVVIAAFLATACFDSLADTPTYNDSSRTLDLPVLNIGGTYYYGIQVKLDNFLLVRGATGSGACDPGIRMDLASQPDFSCFPDQTSFDDALTGTWISGSDYTGKITLTFPPSNGGYGSGVFSTYTTPKTATYLGATYHNCNFTSSPSGSSPEVGFRPFSLESINCDEGSVPMMPGLLPDTTLTIADQLLVNAYGGSNRIDRLVVSNIRAGGFNSVVLTKAGK